MLIRKIDKSNVQFCFKRSFKSLSMIGVPILCVLNALKCPFSVNILIVKAPQ